MSFNKSKDQTAATAGFKPNVGTTDNSNIKDDKFKVTFPTQAPSSKPTTTITTKPTASPTRLGVSNKLDKFASSGIGLKKPTEPAKGAAVEEKIDSDYEDDDDDWNISGDEKDVKPATSGKTGTLTTGLNAKTTTKETPGVDLKGGLKPTT
jgi:hypothetical protein